MDPNTAPVVDHRGPTRGRRPRALKLLALGAAASLVVVVVLQLLPSPVTPSSPASAALQKLAHLAAAQPAIPPSDSEWLQAGESGSLLVSYTEVGPTATPGATAVIGTSVTNWSNTSDETCTGANFTSVSFLSNDAQSAWIGAGLKSAVPSTTYAGCIVIDATPSVGAGDGAGVIDVSKLPTDPGALASALESGSTGIPGVDMTDLSPYARAVKLLVGPTIGATPQFKSALLGASRHFRGFTF